MVQVALAEFRETPATQVASLGPRCATSYNVRRCFGHGSAFPFDWWITPDDGIVHVLENFDCDYIYRPELLELTDRAQSVVHKPSGILLHHEFPRNSPPNNYVLPGFRDAIARPKKRSQYLFDKFLDLNKADERILFVREGPIDPRLTQVLARIFDLAQWSIASVEGLPSDGGAHGWKGPPDAWDEALGTIGARLDTSRLKPFEDK